jgi:hypothetical protein
MSDKSIATTADINVKINIDVSGYFLRDSIIADIINNIPISINSIGPFIPYFSSPIIVDIININISFVILLIDINSIILLSIGLFAKLFLSSVIYLFSFNIRS